MRVRVMLVAASAVALALAGCTPLPVHLQRAADRPLLVPQGLQWQYVTSCFGDDIGGGGVLTFSFGEGDSEVVFAEETPEAQVESERLEACLDEFRIDDSDNDLDYVDGYERSQLWTYYTAVTAPCLAAHGVDLEPVPREQFFVPDQRPWDPYISMQGRSFSELIELYAACPPIPAFLQGDNRS